ncbi:MAG: hypothetical protein HOP14_01385 [Acidobacteria bacterium]|nr:hypothetical protein [Acidobacteriota bacterium]
MSMLELLEASAFASWVRESDSVWAYPTVLFLHTLGLAFLVGLNTAVDLRLLGVARSWPLASVVRFMPVMWAGFWINALSGAVLLAADATTKTMMPVFWVKLAFVAVGMMHMAWLKPAVIRVAVSAGDRLPPHARLVAAGSLLAWTGATVAGRLMAYLGPGSTF